MDPRGHRAASSADLVPGYARDLNIDQIVEAITEELDDREFLTSALYKRLDDPIAVRHRQQVFGDLANVQLLERLKAFSAAMRQVNLYLAQTAKMENVHHRGGRHLQAATLYCRAVSSLANDCRSFRLMSAGLTAFRDHLTRLVASPEFNDLARDAAVTRDQLSRIRYCVMIRGGRVVVTEYDNQLDYTIEVEELFGRFRQGAVQDYRIPYRLEPEFGHVGARILDCVAALFRTEFATLQTFCSEHADFVHRTIADFDRELCFYLGYLEFTRPIRAAGLPFCLPQVDSESKAVNARETFDLALAAKLTADKRTVVCNDFSLEDRERMIVVSGPNQGGKTTFARTFGQLHHFAAVGCPVAGSSARLFLCDEIFTHFERVENLPDMRGKLEDDLLRVRHVLRYATGNSVVILNEIFTCTTLADALFLGTKVMGRLVDLNVLGIYVTFIDELASFADSVVSMMSKVVPEDPARRTFRVERAPADGLAYAFAIAEKYDVTYDRLLRRVQR